MLSRRRWQLDAANNTLIIYNTLLASTTIHHKLFSLVVLSIRCPLQHLPGKACVFSSQHVSKPVLFSSSYLLWHRFLASLFVMVASCLANDAALSLVKCNAFSCYLPNNYSRSLLVRSSSGILQKDIRSVHCYFNILQSYPFYMHIYMSSPYGVVSFMFDVLCRLFEC